MAHLIDIPVFDSEKGQLTVVEGLLPGNIKRLYYIDDVPSDAQRGGHRHHKTVQILICIKGSCTVYCDNGIEENNFLLDSKRKGVVVNPEDWHVMENFSEGAILLVIANELYDVNDYIDQSYRERTLF
ncbi:WxcM-like, C-terminal [Spirosomataceae bacterium TFI 002]|nr:WxcM-like, C-terminal [Spirosomataceae bacterium TFI 002]